MLRQKAAVRSGLSMTGDRRGYLTVCALLVALAATPALALDRPWVSDVFFYWYTYDRDTELGGWMGGVYNTPLGGYYDSPRYADNLASLHQASEWGLTHHFMDYWGHGWKDDRGNPREDVVMRATEDLQKRGYNIRMSFYQDGTDFDMARFSRNLEPKRDTEFYLQRYGQSPALPTIDGKPVFLIYGRNGSPKTDATDEGFQSALRERYRTVAALNARWGTGFKDFREVKLDFGARGHLRAESIRYQYAVWAEEIGRTNAVARERFKLPGCVFSWDIGYRPFRGWGYTNQARVFAGPHSYGGIFGVPHDADCERFIQAQVAKRTDTVFFDTFKNFYHDWEIRIPGTCYSPGFCAFDRFWVQALSHYSEALLHLSWNEWWEGSNLEPCYEFGKTYCEKNLLYSTILQQCFDSVHNWNRGARVAVLLNDWHWLVGGRHPEDIYACIQALRRNCLRFDLVPDDDVTAQELGQFDVIVAPSGGEGFGTNRAQEAILPLLLAWAAERPTRRLILDDFPTAGKELGLALAPPRPGTLPMGGDMSLFVDVGTEEDEWFVVDGVSGREDWGQLPADKFGAAREKHTVRWTPGSGLTTSFRLPFSPGRDHVLRLMGSAIWGNRATVLVEGTRAGEFEIKPGDNTYEVPLPARVVGGRALCELTLQYAAANIPLERDPGRYPGEGRACNLALDWLQLATANLPFSREQNYRLPEEGVRFEPGAAGFPAGQTLATADARHMAVADAGTVLSRYTSDGFARDMVVGAAGNILFVNGLLGGVTDAGYLDGMLRGWAGCRPELDIAARDIIATPLKAGETDIIAAYNYAAPETRDLTLTLPQTADNPIVELRALAHDSQTHLPLSGEAAAPDPCVVRDKLQFCAVYQVTRGPVALTVPALALAPGQTKPVGVTLAHRRGGGATEPVAGTVRLLSHLPSLTSDVASFRVGPGAATTVALAITARPDIDWGTKTVVFDVEVGGRHSYFWRSLLVNRLPELQVTSGVVDAANPQATLTAVPFPWAQDAAAEDVRVRVGDKQVSVGTVAPGRGVPFTVPGCPPAGPTARLVELPGTVDYTVGGVPHSARLPLACVTCPTRFPRTADAVAPLVVTNPHAEYLENALVSVELADRVPAGKPAYVREAGGSVVPSQVVGSTLYWIAMLPPKSATVYTLCAGTAPQPGTDLRVETGADGVTVQNSNLLLGWSSQAGGTLTTFRSLATGRDYAAGSCGGGIGEWGKFNPLKPATNTVEFVGQEKKAWQRNITGPVRLRPGLRGPVIATVAVEAVLNATIYVQHYTLGAFQHDFLVEAEVTAPEPMAEIVALDVRLARNQLTKIFPNFTGIAEGFTSDQPTAGWREAPGVPPYATFMTPGEFAESISVSPRETRQGPQEAAASGVAGVPADAGGGTRVPGANKFRQGFWPARRPQPGPVTQAQIELIATDARRCQVAARILVHPGPPRVARLFRLSHVDQPPTVFVPTRFAWEQEARPTPAAAAGEWWSPYWHYAVPVTVGPLDKRGANPTVTFKPRLETLLAGCGSLDPASPRAIVHRAGTMTELPVSFLPATGELTVTLTDAAWGTSPPPVREFRLYFDVLEVGTKCAGRRATSPLSTRLLNGDFEKTGEHWSLWGATLSPQAGHSGAAGARLAWKRDMPPVGLSNATLRVRPNAHYRITFWARTDSPRAQVRTNFYAGARYDFGQLAVPLITGNQWRRYSVVLAVGDFPPEVNPALRFWVLGEEQTVLLDDVEVEAIDGAAQEPPVVVGERLANSG